MYFLYLEIIGAEEWLDEERNYCKENSMKKKIVTLLVMLITGAMLLSGCSMQKSTDEAFLDDMAAGLEARWEFADSDEDSDDKEGWEKCINFEYDKIHKYKNKKFEDKKLGKLAKAYINLIDESKKDLKYYGNDAKFTAKMDEITYQRAAIIYKLIKSGDLKIDKKYKDDIDEFKEVGKTYLAVNKIMEKADFKQTKDEYGWKTYDAVVENTTSSDFSYFNFNINLIDKDGTVVETTMASTDNWEAGTKHRFEFTSDSKFSKVEVKSCDYGY